MIPGFVSYTLDIRIALLNICLLTLTAARIKWLNERRTKSFCSLIHATEPPFSNIFGFGDDFNFPLQNHWNGDIHYSEYNGWKCKCFVSQVLLLGTDGCDIFAYVHAGGSWHCRRIFQYLVSRHFNLTGDY